MPLNLIEKPVPVQNSVCAVFVRDIFYREKPVPQIAFADEIVKLIHFYRIAMFYCMHKYCSDFIGVIKVPVIRENVGAFIHLECVIHIYCSVMGMIFYVRVGNARYSDSGIITFCYLVCKR